MADITESMKAKSDQLNAMDIMGSPLIIKVREVDYNSQREQPVWIYFDGDNGKPYKPSKGMIRVIGGAWGKLTEEWIGKYAKLFYEASVTWAGKEIGGIWVKEFSDIPVRGLNFSLAINRTKRIPFPIALLSIKATEYPAAQFEKALPTMTKMMKEGDMTLQQIISKCQQTGQLTTEQLASLEAAAPVDVSENDDEETM
jgi:hypothetical protein